MQLEDISQKQKFRSSARKTAEHQHTTSGYLIVKVG